MSSLNRKHNVTIMQTPDGRVTSIRVNGRDHSDKSSRPNRLNKGSSETPMYDKLVALKKIANSDTDKDMGDDGGGGAPPAPSMG